MTIGGCFATYHVMLLGWLKKKERKKMTNSDFWSFQVCHFKIVTIHIAITTADLDKFYKLLDVALNVSNCSPAIMSSCKC